MSTDALAKVATSCKKIPTVIHLSLSRPLNWSTDCMTVASATPRPTRTGPCRPLGPLSLPGPPPSLAISYATVLVVLTVAVASALARLPADFHHRATTSSMLPPSCSHCSTLRTAPRSLLSPSFFLTTPGHRPAACRVILWVRPRPRHPHTTSKRSQSLRAYG